jgi:hypothetical protein
LADVEVIVDQKIASKDKIHKDDGPREGDIKGWEGSIAGTHHPALSQV